MHYYQFNIGEYRAATAHLSNEEDLAYRRLLDMYYDSENKIPLDTEWVSRRLRLEPHVVRDVLQDMFVKQDDGWLHSKCEELIQIYQAMAEKNRANGRLGGRKKNPVANPLATQPEPIAKATINYELLTNNQVLKKQRGSRLPQDFVLLKEWSDFCTQQRPDLNLQNTFDSFKDFWVAKAGSGGVKLDWLATWRNWVRNQSAPKASFAQIHADIARTTVPRNQAYEDTQRRLREEADRKCSGPSLEVLAKMAAIRKGAPLGESNEL